MGGGQAAVAVNILGRLFSQWRLCPNMETSAWLPPGAEDGLVLLLWAPGYDTVTCQASGVKLKQAITKDRESISKT